MHRWTRFAPGLLLIAASGFVECAAQTPPPSTPTSVATGQKVYMQNCSGCHGPEGKGGIGGENGPKSPNLTSGIWTHGTTDVDIFNVIKNGVPPNYFMIPWDGQIQDEDIWNIVHYLRTLQVKP